MSYRDILNDFLNKGDMAEINRMTAASIFDRVTYMIKTGEILKYKKNFGLMISNIDEILNTLISKYRGEYKASIFPMILSFEKGRNFWISKYIADEEEYYRILYLLLSGVLYADMIVNIDGIPLQKWDHYRRILLNDKLLVERGGKCQLDYNSMASRIYKMPLWAHLRKGNVRFEYIFGFTVLGYFAYWVKREMGDLRYLGIRDDSSLVIFKIIPKGKSTWSIIPRINRFLNRWFKEYIENKDIEYPYLCRFITSLYIREEDVKSLNQINKFLFYLMNDYVSGELLSSLIELKAFHELKKKEGKIYGITGSGNFYSRL